MKTFKQFITEEDDAFDALEYAGNVFNQDIYFAVVDVEEETATIDVEKITPQELVDQINDEMSEDGDDFEEMTVGSEEYMEFITPITTNGSEVLEFSSGRGGYIPTRVYAINKQELFKAIEGVAQTYKTYKDYNDSPFGGKISDAEWNKILQKAQNDINNLP